MAVPHTTEHTTMASSPSVDDARHRLDAIEANLAAALWSGMHLHDPDGLRALQRDHTDALLALDTVAGPGPAGEMSPSRRRLLIVALRRQGMSQDGIAARLGIGRTMVQETLLAAEGRPRRRAR